MSNLICCGVLSQDGRILIRRAFISDDTKIEGLISFISKTIASSTHFENTLVNFDNTRFLFQSVDQVYLFLASHKNSNIIEDHETLSNLAKIVTAVVGSAVDERNVTEYMFDIVFAWDEAVSNGLSNHLMTEEIGVYCKMHSQEEEAILEERKRKERAAKEFNAQRMRELDELRTGYARPSNPVLSVLSQVLNRISGEHEDEQPKGHIGDSADIRKTGASATSESYERERSRIENISTRDPFTGVSFKQSRSSRRKRSAAAASSAIPEEDDEAMQPTARPINQDDDEPLEVAPPRRTMNLRSHQQKLSRRGPGGRRAKATAAAEQVEEVEQSPAATPEDEAPAAEPPREDDVDEEQRPRRKKKARRAPAAEDEDVEFLGDADDQPQPPRRKRRAAQREEESGGEEEAPAPPHRKRGAQKARQPVEEEGEEEEEEQPVMKKKAKKAARREEPSDEEEFSASEPETQRAPPRRSLRSSRQ